MLIRYQSLGCSVQQQTNKPDRLVMFTVGFCELWLQLPSHFNMNILLWECLIYETPWHIQTSTNDYQGKTELDVTIMLMTEYGYKNTSFKWSLQMSYDHSNHRWWYDKLLKQYPNVWNDFQICKQQKTVSAKFQDQDIYPDERIRMYSLWIGVCLFLFCLFCHLLRYGKWCVNTDKRSDNVLKC